MIPNLSPGQRALLFCALLPVNGWAYLFGLPQPHWEWYWRVPGAVFVLMQCTWAFEAVRDWIIYRREQRLALAREIMET